MTETEYAVKEVWKMPKEKGVWSPEWSFYITLLNGNWLSSEDKEFCYLQVDNKGAMGYFLFQNSNSYILQ